MPACDVGLSASERASESASALLNVSADHAPTGSRYTSHVRGHAPHSTFKPASPLLATMPRNSHLPGSIFTTPVHPARLLRALSLSLPLAGFW